MATKLESAPRNGASPGQDGERFRLEPPPGRRARVPELVVGLGLMVGFALAAVLWHSSTTERVAALALANPVARGEVIEASDLRVVQLSADSVAYLGQEDAEVLLGRPAAADLPAGALLSAASVDADVSIGPGEGVVGLALDPGQYPASDLVPGDVVNVIAAGDAAASVANPVLVSGAVVYAVTDIGTQGKRFVSIKLAVADANRVAAAAERGPVRLVLVGNG